MLFFDWMIIAYYLIAVFANRRELYPEFDFMEDAMPVEYTLPRFFYISLTRLATS